MQKKTRNIHKSSFMFLARTLLCAPLWFINMNINYYIHALRLRICRHKIESFYYIFFQISCVTISWSFLIFRGLTSALVCLCQLKLAFADTHLFNMRTGSQNRPKVWQDTKEFWLLSIFDNKLPQVTHGQF